MILTSQEINQQIAQAEEAFVSQDYNKAATILYDITKTEPNIALPYRKLAFILMRTKRPEEALPFLNRAIEIDSDESVNWSALGVYYKIIKKPEEALKVYRKLIQMEPENISFIHNYAQLLQLTDREGALDIYEALICRDDIATLPSAITEWYDLKIEFHFTQETRATLQMLSEKNPDNETIRQLYASSCTEDLDDIEALKVYEEIYRLSPDDMKTLFNMGVLYSRMGEKSKAEECLKGVLSKIPLQMGALGALCHSHKFQEGDELFENLNYALKHISVLPEEERCKLHYMAGKAYDDVGKYMMAFEHYRLGGVLRNLELDEDKDANIAMRRQLDRAKRVLTKDFFENNRERGCESRKPVFILGMPRSGTTLMEQVLSSMQGVYGAGELPYNMGILNEMKVADFKLDFGRRKSYFPDLENPCYRERGAKYVELMEALAPKESIRIIDKLPNNFTWLGYLYLIMPNASFIHSRRHPIETCLSAYRINFAAGLHWSNDLQSMGRYYRIYTELIAHWKSVLPEGTILDVRYEDMVADLEKESKRIASFIGVEWDSSCLAFQDSKRAVRTASISQVRQPIYATSTNRWRKYEPYLKPLLDEIGDLMEEYEMELGN